MGRGAAALLLLTGCAGAASPAPLLPGWHGVAALLDSITAQGAAPGAVVGVSYRGVHRFYGAGRLGQDDPTRPDSSTIYDLASLTKVIGLTTAVMLAVNEGRLEVDSPVVRYLPLFGADSTRPERRDVTLRHLLTHSSGLPAFRLLYQETTTRSAALALADTTRLDTLPGTRYVYSDLGAIILTQAVEKVYGERIDSLLARRVFTPLAMRDTRYLPPPAWRPRIAPTEDDPWRGRILRGEVHDENAARLEGVSGHAGLFSSARDLLRFGDWLMGGWTLDQGGPTTCAGGMPASVTWPAIGEIKAFAQRQDLPPGSTRALGWDTPSANGSSAGTRFSRRSIGHTGFTGTSIWIDPDRCLTVVLLSNRVHPTRDNPRWGPVRALVADRVVDAIGDDELRR